MQAAHLPLCSERILLRRLSTDDLRAFQHYRHDESVGRYQGWTPKSDVDALTFLNDMNAVAFLAPGEWLQLGIVEREKETLIGDVGLHVRDDGKHADIGFSLASEAQGRGLATEAVTAAIGLLFEYTLIESVIGSTDARNTSSMRLMERIGMHRISTDQAMFRDEPCIEHSYELLRQDWAARK